MSAEAGDLLLQLVNAVTVAHVLSEVVEAVEPVVDGPGDQDQRHGDDGDRP